MKFVTSQICGFQQFSTHLYCLVRLDCSGCGLLGFVSVMNKLFVVVIVVVVRNWDLSRYISSNSTHTMAVARKKPMTEAMPMKNL